MVVIPLLRAMRYSARIIVKQIVAQFDVTKCDKLHTDIDKHGWLATSITQDNG